MVTKLGMEQMINPVMSDPVDEIIEQFETGWSPKSRLRIPQLLREHDLSDDLEAITELIRIDIEFRYKLGLTIDLDEYLNQFDVLLDAPGNIAQIAFEDYRSRLSHGHEVAPKRWQNLPGVGKEAWFRKLATEDALVTFRVTEGERLESFSVINRKGFALHSNDSFAGEINPQLLSEITEAGFRLITQLGSGRLSRVYLATQQDLAERFVVVKIVTHPLAEHENMAMLLHTNIVPIYSFHQVDSCSMIVMPYAGNLTLEAFLRNRDEKSISGESLVSTVQACADKTETAISDAGLRRFTTSSDLNPAANDRETLQPLDVIRNLSHSKLTTWMFVRLASGLAHSHERGILHNDLKPANVLIRNDGEPALLDFNLSHSTEKNDRKVPGGSLPYMSAESLDAFLKNEVALKPTSDVFSLGVMLYQFATGRMLYPNPKKQDRDSIKATMELRKSPVVWQPTDDVSPGLRAIIEKCLRFDPAQRYQTAKQLEHDLRLEHEDRSLRHATEPRGWKAKKWIRRHPSTTSVGAVGTVLLSTLVVVSMIAIAAKGRSNLLSALAQKDAFCERSAEVLSSVISDPGRRSAKVIDFGMEPLEEFGVLDSTKRQDLLSESLPDDERMELRNTMLRHVVQMGAFESARLHDQQVSNQLLNQNEQPLDFARLESLVDASVDLTRSYPSRSCLFLQAAMSRLMGKDDEYQKLKLQAEDTPATHDSEIYLEAIRLMTITQHDQARKLLVPLAGKGSIPSAHHWAMLARSQFGVRQYEDAKLSFTQAITLAPKAFELMWLRGVCHVRLKEYGFAQMDFTKAIELDPSDFRAYLSRANVIRAQQVPGEASEEVLMRVLEDLNRALERSPDNVTILLSRWKTYDALGKHDLAQKDLEMVKNSTNYTYATLRNRGMALRETDPEAAIRDFEAALKFDPQSTPLMMAIGHLLSERLGKNAQALEYNDRVLEIQPKREAALVDRSVLLARMGRQQEARKAMEEALGMEPGGRTHFQAARTCAMSQLQQRSIIHLSKALAMGHNAIDEVTQENLLETSPDFDSLRKMPGFKAFRLIHETSLKERKGKTKPQDDVEKP